MPRTVKSRFKTLMPHAIFHNSFGAFSPTFHYGLTACLLNAANMFGNRLMLVMLSAVVGWTIAAAWPRYSSDGPIVTDLRFYPVSVRPGASMIATFFGADYLESIYFDVRFRQPGNNQDQVALNWQRGTSFAHVVP